MLANFYYESSTTAVVIGALAGLALVIGLGFTRRPILGAVFGALGCGLIACTVWACGEGDVVGLFYLLIAVPLAAICGGAAGVISVSVVRRIRTPSNDRAKGAEEGSDDPP
ncbi:MAG TPA: hypothetical protein PKJ98_04815 [Verrucomicrobiota bacterium]|nr:hypothetical protein [Verrucomicrobiota bacterium]